jgi:hypothetical protein
MKKIISEWKWHSNKNSPDPAKEIVDEFDFNGDGRLNPKEFVLAMIINNKMLNIDAKCINCMEIIIKDLINPIFMYLDCTGDEKISAENIWSTLSKLKRSVPNAFNFYLCNYQDGHYRTSACNDFIIKGKHSVDGYVTKSEFALAILQGYWSRQVDEYKIYGNDDYNMKKLRWNDDGSVDKICENLKALAKNTS